MLELLEMLVIGFVIGMTGALMPGPMLFATIDLSLKNGWTAGPKIFVGHVIIEFVVCILIVLGITSISDDIVFAISMIGGAILIVFGLMTIKDAKNAANSTGENTGSSGNPLAIGIITSATNPYFWIWWLAAGSALLLHGLEISILAAILFVLGHWLADLTYFTAVSTSFSKGKKIMSPKVYERVLLSCGLFLVLFGSWFVLGT
jgi:threonine/homoserine/homoserine lactone efflux protein